MSQVSKWIQKGEEVVSQLVFEQDIQQLCDDLCQATINLKHVFVHYSSDMDPKEASTAFYHLYLAASKFTDVCGLGPDNVDSTSAALLANNSIGSVSMVLICDR